MAHILLVDDDDNVRSLMKEIVLMAGHTCDEAVNGSEGLAKLRKGKYDLAIFDRNMPVMDGIQAITTLRAFPQFKDFKVLMCTSASVNKEVEEAFAAGATDYILKPINLQMLIGKLNKHLGPPAA